MEVEDLEKANIVLKPKHLMMKHVIFKHVMMKNVIKLVTSALRFLLISDLKILFSGLSLFSLLSGSSKLESLATDASSDKSM